MCPAPLGSPSEARKEAEEAKGYIALSSLRAAVPKETEADGLVELVLRSSRELLHPEEIVAEATRDLVKEEIRRHLERKLKEDPGLSQELKDAVKELLEARAREYSALLRVTAAAARLGFEAIPESVRGRVAKDLAELVNRELGNLVEKTL